MLLEFNEDTDEVKMHDKALQLRHRVASRKLNEAVDQDKLSVDDLLFMREKNREARHDHGTDELDLTEVEIKERVALARSDQHFKAEKQVTTLAKDVARASRLSKARLDSLIDLEKRIMTMRGQLHAPNVRNIDSVIATELQTNNKLVRLEGKFEVCSICSRRILAALMPTHARACAIQAKEETDRKSSHLPGPTGVSNLEQDVVTSLATFKPQPPRNIAIKEIGISFIEWKWDPPVIDGGLEIIDYEIAYQGRYSVFNRDIGKFKRWEEDVPSLRTSMWVFRTAPVCSTGFKIMGLRADTEYCNFKIRSLNLRGWSDWVPMLTPTETMPFPLLKTLTSVAPSPPLFVTADNITSSCIHLSWSPPFFDGGVPIIEYFVHYTVVELVVTVTERDKKVEKQKSFCTESADCCAVIRHLPDDSDILDIYVVARNYDLKMGDKGYCKVPKEKKCLRTQPSSLHARLLREMEITANSTEQFIDSAFFTGIKQRYLRVEHMRKLREDLAITPPDPLEIEEDKEWAAVVERATFRKQMEEEALRMALELEAKNKAAQADEDALTREHGDLGFTYQQRSDQFQRKIKSLEARLVTLTQERSEIDKKRIYATSQMRAKEKRMMALQLEKERLKEYPGSVVTSSVLVGADMQYNIADFRRRVEKAVEECMKDIAALKYAVITGENRRQQIKFDLERAADQRQERMAKFHEFESNFQKTMKIMKKFNGREADEKIKLLYFRRLQQHRVDRIALRDKIAHTFQQVQLRYLKIAFHLWKTGENDTSSQNTRAHRSVGGILLQRALEKREELQALLRVTMSETAVIKQKLELSTMSKENRHQLQQMTHFKQTEEGLDHVKLVKDRGLSLMYEGDAYAQENKFPLAIQCYEGQILLIRTAGRVAAMRQQHARARRSSSSSSAMTTDVKGLALCHGRMGRLFTKMGNASRAIVEFDRQLSLAREIDDKAEESDAYYGLGAGYYQNYDYDNAIRYLSIAQAQYVSLGRVQRYILTLRLLKECYFRLNKPDKVVVYEEKLRDAESSAQTKLWRMHQRLDDMKSKLTHNAAEIELMVKIERTTYRALELRQYIATCDERVKALDTQIEEQEQRCLEILALLEAIQQELTQAMETDALEMWSALVHDQPQVVEIEELKTRLKQRQQVELKRLDSEREMKKTLLVRLKNVENDIVEADQQLTLEDGALMKHARLERSFRCVGLCAANVAGNEVTGTATGGVEAFAASEGNHIHWIDYHSGELLHIFLGGNSDTGHVGIITCLLHDGALLFSGGTDETIICWDTVQRKMVRKLEGHEGSIVALASESRSWLISSAADTTMRLWEKHSGQLLRVLFGHAKSVLAMEIGPTWLLTGSADCELRVWKISTQEKVMQGQQSSTHHPGGGGGGGGGGGLLLDKITPDSEYAPQLDYENIPAPPPLPSLNSAKGTGTSPFDSKATVKGKKAKEQEAKVKEAQEKQRRLVEEARLKVLKEKEAAAAAAAAGAGAGGGAAGAGGGAGEAASPPRKKRGHHHYHRRPHHVTVDCVNRLTGHEVPITCVKYGNMEVLSGDVLGRIFIWWLSTGQILRKCQVHRGPVKAIQFDSVHIVSGGMDAAVAITDIATGEPLQSLRGHEKSILALAFDSERILSVGGDNTIRYWQWGKKAGPQDKLHVLGPSETLAMVAKQYQITVDNVMKWNGITESRQCHPGMKLIVKKGDPNALTHAEKVAAERELRRSRGLAWAAKKLARIGSGGGSGADDEKQQQAEAKRFHRVKSLALDQDPFSLNNRLFGREKRQLELFPDTTLAHEDDYSLAARIQAAADSGHAETSDAARIHQDRVQRQLQRAIRYFISVDNEDEWGSVGDDLGLEMLQMMVELMAYECVIEAKNAQRSKFSVMGRIFIHQEQRRVAMLEAAEAEAAAAAAAKKAAEDEEAAAAAAAAAETEATGDGAGEGHNGDNDGAAAAAAAATRTTAAVAATATTAAAAATTTANAADDDDNSVKRRHRRTSIAEQRKRERKEQRHLRKSVTQTVVDAARQDVAAHEASAGTGLPPDEAEGQIVHSHARDAPAPARTAMTEHQEAAAVAQMMDAYIEQLVASPSSPPPPQPPVTSATVTATSRPSSGRHNNNSSSSNGRRGTATESMPQPQPSSRSSSVSVKLPPLV